MENHDLRRWRADTPGCARVMHLNNAGAALIPVPVHDAIRNHLEREMLEGGYESAERVTALIDDAYEALGQMLNSPARNVAVVENATVAVAQALSAYDFKPGDAIVTSRIDYPSNQLMYLSLGRRLGVELLRADDLPSGGIDPDSVRRLLRTRRCRLVSLSWIPTNSGLVQPVEEVGKVCEEAGVPYLIDACQAIGQLPIDVRSLRCDYLAGTARKFLRGPRGIGFLYVSDRALDRGEAPLYIDMRGADWTDANEYRVAQGARRFENWEFSYALLLGMGAAARYALGVGQPAFERSHALAEFTRGLLAKRGGVRVEDRGSQRCAIVTLAIPGRDANDVKLALRARGVNTSASNRDDGVLDMDEKGITSVLRISPHYYNTEAEITAALEMLDRVLL